MAMIRVAVLMLSVFLACGANAQLVEFRSSGLAADLHCPAKRTTPRKPASVATPVEVMEPPAPEEVELLPVPDLAPEQGLGFQGQNPRVPGQPPSIAFWGDSHLAAHFFGDELIRLSGLPRARVLPTFIPATMGRAGVRLPIRKSCLSQGWSYKHAYLAKEMGTQFPQSLSVSRNSTPGSYLWVDFRLSGQTPNLRGVDVLFQPSAGAEPLVLGVSIDDGGEQLVELDQAGAGMLQLRTDQAMSVIRLRLVSGVLALEGFAPQYLESEPALRMDTFAIPGAMAKGWANVSSDYVLSRLGATRYDLVAFEYGTNEGNNKPFSAAAYAADLRQALSNMRRVFPDSSCVLIGPTDRGVLVKASRGKPAKSTKNSTKGKKGSKPVKPQKARVVVPARELLGYATIHQEIGALQRSIGREFSCAYWGWQDFMGGPGSAYRWLYRSPAWMARDLTHLTILGYQASARSFAESIHFQTWLNREAPAP